MIVSSCSFLILFIFAPISLNAVSEYIPISKENLLATLPSFGKDFEVSFQFWVESFNGPNRAGYSELLRFTTTEKECCSPGDRIPAIFINKAGYVHLTSQIGTNGNYYKNVNIKSQAWIKVEIKQYAENGKAMYEVIVDENSVLKIENTEPKKYENVKVWAARGDHYPAAQARIKNLMSNGQSIQTSADKGGKICADTNGNGEFNRKCLFPFHYDGKSFTSCTKHGHDSLWCSTKTDANNNHITHQWGNCGECFKDGGKTVIEVKTGSNPIDSSDGTFRTQFFSSDGTSCTMRDLDNPQKDDFESGKVDQFTGSMLGPCETFHPENISSVKITHTSGEGWRGEYLKISYEFFSLMKSFTCKLGKMLDNMASITFPCIESKGFVKVFSHDTSGGFFTNDQDALSKNSDDPSAKLYSILNKLEDYRGSDGSFHFKLCYPEVTGIGGSSCNEWFQSSNPTAIGLKYGKIKGFKAISLAFTRGSAGRPWKGIGKSVSGTNFIDDAPEIGSWWTAIGARRGHPKGSSKIPGPTPNVVTKVELYVIITTTPTTTTTTITTTTTTIKM